VTVRVTAPATELEVPRISCADASLPGGTWRASKKTMRSVLVLALSLPLAGCTAGPRGSESQRSEPQPGSGVKPLAQAVLEVFGRMHERFAATNRMHHAIALSDLGRAHLEAKLVADLDEPNLLPEWQPYVAEIREAARAVAATDDPIAAARTMAMLGRACARCHQAANAKLDLVGDPMPTAAPELRVTMATHQWAAGRMWHGLVSRSTKSWLEGARALEGAPLAITAEVDQPPHGIGIADDVARIRVLARRAQTTVELDARTELYGEVLSTCVSCHATIRDH